MPYPITIVQDRYNGVYSGGKWLALKQYATDIPYELDSDDTTCIDFWFRTKQIIGKGNTPNEALKDLINKLKTNK